MAFVRELKRDFVRLIEKGKLAQGYLFFGEAAKIQRDFGEGLAAYLETKRWAWPGAPLIDAWVVEDEGGTLGIELSRAVQKFLWQKPLAAPRKTVIIPQAHRLTAAAQNAVLRIAEEPPEHGLLILTVCHLDRLVAPLTSRFPKVFFSTGEHNGVPAGHTALKQFLSLGARERSELLKSLQEDREAIEQLVEGCLAYFASNLGRYWPFAKQLLQRFSVINQLNTNRRLQLEAALLKLPKV